MNREDEVFNRAFVRQARPPAQGTSSIEAGAGRSSTGPTRSTTIIDEDGKVRRLWTPGDPWTDDFYFGSNE